MASTARLKTRSDDGRFGEYGGRFVPEALFGALDELEAERRRAFKDREFLAELDRLLAEVAGRPTPLYLAERLTREIGGARIWLKRED
ncbi:MAG: tryptophan synthase subunit beta, partial [Actinomycetota bacterium]